MIGDDHEPFMERGVEILHIIPSPFPRVWHNRDDDGEHLHLATVVDWTKLITAFVAEWMELDGFLNASHSASNHRESLSARERQQRYDKSEL